MQLENVLLVIGKHHLGRQLSINKPANPQSCCSLFRAESHFKLNSFAVTFHFGCSLIVHYFSQEAALNEIFSVPSNPIYSTYA